MEREKLNVSPCYNPVTLPPIARPVATANHVSQINLWSLQTDNRFFIFSEGFHQYRTPFGRRVANLPVSSFDAGKHSGQTVVVRLGNWIKFVVMAPRTIDCQSNSGCDYTGDDIVEIIGSSLPQGPFDVNGRRWRISAPKTVMAARHLTNCVIL